MVKLLPSESQARALEATLRRVNEACDYASAVAWGARILGKYKLQQATYQDIKSRFGLTAQVVIRLLAKVADAYKLDKQTRRTFRPLGAIAYDDRILRWYSEASEVSIWTVAEGEAKPRQRIPFVCDERTRALLDAKQRKGESDLVYRGGKWYLLATVEVEEPPPGTPEDWLGVDLGITNLATDSDGEAHTDLRVEKSRKRYERIRSKLQRAADSATKAKGRKSARRHLKKLSGRERRFKRNTNHVLSRRIVDKAKESDRGISLEDLKGIRARTGKRLRRSQRGRGFAGKWAFGELRGFLEYKARLAGVALVCVDPAYTSQTCNECGHCERANRRSQREFACKGCVDTLPTPTSMHRGT